jgi:hypothetical protein
MNTVDEVKAALEKLADVRAHMDLLKAEKKAEYDIILAAVADKLEGIDGEYDRTIGTLEITASVLDADIKASWLTLSPTLGDMKSLKCDHLMVMYSAPHPVWDSKKLAGFAMAHPEILAARSMSEPKVTIKGV